jgi:hypothetical protein
MPVTTDSDELERIASYPSGHEVRTDSNGNIHIFRKRAESGGTADTRPSKLREAQARINSQRDAEREGLAAFNKRNREFYGEK